MNKKLLCTLIFASSLAAAPNQLHIKLSKKPQSYNSSSAQPASSNPNSPPPTAFPNAQKTSLDLKSLMSPAQQKSTGISQLSSGQLSSLESWLSHYIDAEKNQQPTPTGNQLAAVLGEGHYIKLGNGEVWVVSPNSWIYTFYWVKGTPITLGKSGDMLFPTLLTNTHTGEAVNAIAASKDTTKAFSSNTEIKKVANEGQFVTLSDGSTWEVEPSTRFMVQTWAPGTYAYIVKRPSMTTGAGYELYNGETSRAVFVNQVKAPTQPDLLLKPSTQSTTFPSSQGNQATNQTSTFPTTASNDGQNPPTQSKS